MDQELQKLIHKLQHEKCPPAVLTRVAQRVSDDNIPARQLGPFLAWAVSITCLLAAIGFWQWHIRRGASLAATEITAARAQANRALVVQQTQEAIGYIGQTLVRAAIHTENALLKDAVPPFRNGFETAKTKITKPI
jgi:hypothetical protein